MRWQVKRKGVEISAMKSNAKKRTHQHNGKRRNALKINVDNNWKQPTESKEQMQHNI